MIKVGDIGSNKSISSSKGSKSVSGSSFSSYLSSGVNQEKNAVSATSSVSVANTIFATQMVGQEEEREIKKKVIKRGETLLDKLQDIRDGLLFGQISKEKIIDISRFLRERRFNTDDEKLRSIMEEIELRVEVELAKLTK